jgi:D-alanyl-D-alanine carboxypeptidase (penicillin-binding protein 5/6)
MRGRFLTLLVAVVVAVVAPASAGAQTAAPPPPKAWIVVDADTGAIIDAGNARTPTPPASTIKVLTALIALERLPPQDTIPVSAKAEGMPARKINMKAGQVWDLEDTIITLLTVSANDAAVALAERVGDGSLDAYVEIAQETAERLGMRDSPMLFDPSGLDDEFSNRGGTLISARDLAIAGRAALRQPLIMRAATIPEYRYKGGDGIDHVVRQKNLLLSLYPGATGLKTGYTKRAGRCLIATATRDGRTMLAVVIDAVDSYASAAWLMDKGFATPVAAQGELDHLPPVVEGASIARPDLEAAAAPTPVVEPPLQAATGGDDESGGSSTTRSLVVLVVGGLPAAVILRRRQVVARRARARQARLLARQAMASAPPASPGERPLERSVSG